MKVLMDLVVNHTSDEHPWFQASRRKEEPYKNYYIWRPAGRTGRRPITGTACLRARPGSTTNCARSITCTCLPLSSRI